MALSGDPGDEADESTVEARDEPRTTPAGLSMSEETTRPRVDLTD